MRRHGLIWMTQSVVLCWSLVGPHLSRITFVTACNICDHICHRCDKCVAKNEAHMSHILRQMWSMKILIWHVITFVTGQLWKCKKEQKRVFYIWNTFVTDFSKACFTSQVNVLILICYIVIKLARITLPRLVTCS